MENGKFMKLNRAPLFFVALLSVMLAGGRVKRAHALEMSDGPNDSQSDNALSGFDAAEKLAQENSVDDQTLEALINSAEENRRESGVLKRAAAVLRAHNTQAVQVLSEGMKPGHRGENNTRLTLLYLMDTPESQAAYVTYKPSNFHAYNVGSHDYDTRRPVKDHLPVKEPEPSEPTANE